MKICPVGTELFYADGQTHDKVTIAFRILRTRLMKVNTPLHYVRVNV